jgi:hypothetical protein
MLWITMAAVASTVVVAVELRELVRRAPLSAR